MLTLSFFSSTSLSFISSTAFAASAAVDSVMYPTFGAGSSSEPSTGFNTVLRIVPCGSNSSFSFSADIPSARFLTITFTPRSPAVPPVFPLPLPASFFGAFSRRAAERSSRVCARCTYSKYSGKSSAFAASFVSSPSPLAASALPSSPVASAGFSASASADFSAASRSPSGRMSLRCKASTAFLAAEDSLKLTNPNLFPSPVSCMTADCNSPYSLKTSFTLASSQS
mmetsp:Transcript_4595/g.10035  ORF Transcript_4595/g.10035 Transcript_4595/m.10035 type:complete len:226 (+) Transcript_4595:313-990(+)